MSDSLVPRGPERILEALGANAEFRDAVLGDLAEEFASRAGWDGARAARQWYYKECLRVAPYFVRGWWRGLGRADVTNVASALVWSAASVTAVEWVLRRGIDAFVELATGRSLGTFSASLGISSLMLLWTLVDATLGGYVAARVGRRASLPSALSFGAVVSSVILVDALGSASPLWFRAANVVTVMAGVSLGSLLGIFRMPRDSRLQNEPETSI